MLIKADENIPFSALAFKTATDPFVGSLTYFRVYSGKLNSGSYVLNTRTGNQERISRILRMHANQREEIKEHRWQYRWHRWHERHQDGDTPAPWIRR